mgnify:CR=1 FL=1
MFSFRFGMMAGLALAGALVGSRAEAGFVRGWSVPEAAESHGVDVADMDMDGDLDAYRVVDSGRKRGSVVVTLDPRASTC